MKSSTATSGDSSDRFRFASLGHLSQGWITAVAPIALVKGLRLSASVDPTLPQRIYTNPTALNHIVTELLSNAICYTNAGDIVLTIDRRGAALAVTVRDTGIGIPSHLTSALLNGAVQTRSETVDGKARRSSGMATVQRLTKMLGGSVVLFSRLGKGTTITILLPLHSDPDAPTRP